MSYMLERMSFIETVLLVLAMVAGLIYGIYTEWKKPRKHPLIIALFTMLVFFPLFLVNSYAKQYSGNQVLIEVMNRVIDIGSGVVLATLVVSLILAYKRGFVKEEKKRTFKAAALLLVIVVLLFAVLFLLDYLLKK